MASKFQKRPFPHDKLGILKDITVKTVKNETVDISYQDLKLIVTNGQLCFFYESDDGDLIMPIARKNTIDSLFLKE